MNYEETEVPEIANLLLEQAETANSEVGRGDVQRTSSVLG